MERGREMSFPTSALLLSCRSNLKGICSYRAQENVSNHTIIFLSPPKLAQTNNKVGEEENARTHTSTGGGGLGNAKERQPQTHNKYTINLKI